MIKLILLIIQCVLRSLFIIFHPYLAPFQYCGPDLSTALQKLFLVWVYCDRRKYTGVLNPEKLNDKNETVVGKNHIKNSAYSILLYYCAI